MRAPLQAGDFPFPVKYGYAAVGRAVDGPRTTPRPRRLRAPPAPGRLRRPRRHGRAAAEGPSRRRGRCSPPTWRPRSTSSGTRGPVAGDRIAVVGAGVVGALAAWLCARLPGAEVTLVDVNPDRAALAAALGCGFAPPDAAPADCDLVIHASATGEGLATALAAAGLRGDAWWRRAGTATAPPAVGLGGAFHSRRLRLVSSQVGQVPTARRARWSNRRRLEAALGLLADPALDALIGGETRFADCRDALRGDPRRGPTRSATASSTTEAAPHVRRRGPRPHHDRPQPAGARSSARRRDCTAPPSWSTPRSSPRSSTPHGLVVDIGRATECCAEVLAPLRYQNLDAMPELAGAQHHHGIPLPPRLRRARRRRPRRQARRRRPPPPPARDAPREPHRPRLVRGRPQ